MHEYSQRRSVYVLILFGNPVYAGDAGIIPAGFLFSALCLPTLSGKSRFQRDFTAREREITGKSDESPGAVWIGTGC